MSSNHNFLNSKFSKLLESVSYKLIFGAYRPQQPKVSVIIITYNHSKYISSCLEGVLKQITNFTIECLVGDDFSNDGTSSIISNFEEQNKNLIFHIRRNTNLGQFTGNGRLNLLHSLSLARGKFIAICDGDDFWTDPYKLQKQADYLEENPDCSFCFTDCQIKRKNNLQEIHPNINKKIKFDGIDFADQPGSIAQTCTWLVRREYILNLPNWVKSSYTGDWCMQVHFSKYGKGGYIPEKTAVYRIHDKGVWSKLSPFEGWRKNFEFYKAAIKQFNEKSSRNRLEKRIRNTIIDALELANIHANKSEIRHWLKIKISKFPFTSISQSLHSLKLLSISTFQNKS